MRTTLSILGIALAVGSVLSLVALSRSIEDGLAEGLDEIGADLAVAQRGASDIFGGFLPEEMGDRIAAVPGVAGVAGDLFLFAPSEDDHHVLVSGWKDGSYKWKTTPFREGRAPRPGERRVAVIGDSAADSLKKKVGDELEVLSEKYRIIGITRFASVINRGLVILPLSDLQEATYRKGQVTMFYVGLQRGLSKADIDRVRADIAKLGKLTVSLTSEVLDKDRNFAILQAVSLAIAIIALAMGVINILNTLLMAIQERTREIGIVAAIGWSDRRIMASIVIEGLIMSVIGCAIGIALGYLTSFFFAAIPQIGSIIAFKPSIGLIAPTVIAALILCAIGSLYPAWRATRMTPAEALQRG
jgi:putative ABC transport system permease protein